MAWPSKPTSTVNTERQPTRRSIASLRRPPPPELLRYSQGQRGVLRSFYCKYRGGQVRREASIGGRPSPQAQRPSAARWSAARGRSRCAASYRRAAPRSWDEVGAAAAGPQGASE